MTLPAPALVDAPPAPRKRGPSTPAGKARSRMNALKHGLRAREFGLLPEESQAEWAEHLGDLRAALAPADAYEEKLVAAIAAAMWKEIRADRVECDVLAEIPPLPDRSHGSDLQEPRHALSLNTAVRYATAAGMATQRAQRAFLAHRKAKRAGLVLPAAEPVEVAANRNDTNDFAPDRADAPAVRLDGTSGLPAEPATAAAVTGCTNGFRGPGGRSRQLALADAVARPGDPTGERAPVAPAFGVEDRHLPASGHRQGHAAAGHGRPPRLAGYPSPS